MAERPSQDATLEDDDETDQPGADHDKERELQRGSPTSLRLAAAAAHAAGDHEAALSSWAELRTRYPSVQAGFLGAIRTAKAAGQDDLAADLLKQAAARFPQDPTIQRMNTVANGRDLAWQATDAHWAALAKASPDDPETALAAALAPLAQRQGRNSRLKMVRTRVESVVERFPHFPKACVEHLALLRRTKRFKPAARHAAAYRERFPQEQRLALAHVAILDDLEKYDDALALASALREHATPSSPAIEVAYIQALSRLGRQDAAEAACASAVEAFPDSIDLLREHAVLATRRGDWTEALARWLVAQRLRPDSGKIKQGLDAVRIQLADLELPETELQQGETGRFFARFESLGGTRGGCEFGMVQRQFGSTSLGLLRWSNVQVDALVAGLTNDFDGLGLIENTQLRTITLSADREEYLIRDTKYGLGSHTFIEVKDVPADKMLLQTAKRLTFLRAKLLEELRTANKLFVYKLKEPTDDATLRRIFAAIRHQGHATLLCILKANDANPKGSTRRLEDGLFAGYLGHFMADEAGASRGIDLATWKLICAEALAASSLPQPAPGATDVHPRTN